MPSWSCRAAVPRLCRWSSCPDRRQYLGVDDDRTVRVRLRLSALACRATLVGAQPLGAHRRPSRRGPRPGRVARRAPPAADVPPRRRNAGRRAPEDPRDVVRRRRIQAVESRRAGRGYGPTWCWSTGAGDGCIRSHRWRLLRLHRRLHADLHDLRPARRRCLPPQRERRAHRRTLRLPAEPYQSDVHRPSSRRLPRLPHVGPIPDRCGAPSDDFLIAAISPANSCWLRRRRDPAPRAVRAH